MRPALVVGLAIGLALLAVVAWSFRDALVAMAVPTVAVPVAVASVYRVATLALYARSWQALLAHPQPFLRLLRLRWIGEAVNGMLPVVQVGGDVARARLLTGKGVPAADAAAAMIGDLATGIGTQVAFVILGLAAMGVRGDPGARSLARPVIVGLVLLFVLGVGLWDVFRLGARRIATRLRRLPAVASAWERLAGGAARLDLALQ